MRTTRDRLLLDAIGKHEDALRKIANDFDAIVPAARREKAFGHAEFYEDVQGQLTAAIGHLENAYSRMLNGADWLGVESLED
jgi:hypothetical protein